MVNRVWWGRLTTIVGASCVGAIAAACGGDGWGTTPDQGASSEEPPPASPPIRAVAHGAFLGAEDKPVEPTAEMALATQDFFIRRLLGEASPEVVTEFESRKRDLRVDRAEHVEERVRSTAELLDWLIQAVQPADLALLVNLNGVLRNEFREPGEDPDIGVLNQAITTTTSAAGSAYITACSSAGVPIPPPWGDFNKWKYKGELDPDFLQLSVKASVYAFDSPSPRGVCIALPRHNGTSANFFGIICQGNDTSKACFWDAQSSVALNPSSPVPIVGAAFTGGGDLVNAKGGVCTTCHAGENAFVVHPKTPVDLGPANCFGTACVQKANGWVNPLVSPTWPQNRRPGRDLDLMTLPAGQASCLGCHNKSAHNRFPPLKQNGISGYCANTATFATMGGPGNPRTMPPDTTNPAVFDLYTFHSDAIRNGCGASPSLATRLGNTLPSLTSFSQNLDESYTGDFNNDGREDILRIVPGAAQDAWVSLSKGSGAGSTFDPPTKWHDSFTGSSGRTRVGDFDGDGDDDLLAIFDSETAYDVSKSNGANAFGTRARWWNGPQAFFGNKEVGDVNNDGRDDIIIFNGRTNVTDTSLSVYVQLSTGSSFGAPVLWRTNFALSGKRIDVGDFNGDGFADLIRFEGGASGGASVAVSTGTSFAPGVPWSSSVAPSPLFPRAADMNGDGFSDVVAFTRGTTGGVVVATSNGSTLNSAVAWHSTFGPSPGTVRAGDVDGDGDGDVIYFTGGTAADVFFARGIP